MQGKVQKILLFGFALVYGLVIRIRNWLFDNNILRSTRFDLPVICVGNITVGGTGKTPHIEYLVRLLGDDYNPAVLSRGYKRQTRDFHIVETDSDVSTSGDEPLQIKKKYPYITVAVDRKRVNGVKEILAKRPDTGIILLDDAYQHRYIKAGINILLVDYNRPIGSDCLLPAGRLREHRSSVKRADIIIITKTPPGIQPEEVSRLIKMSVSSSQHLFFTGLRYDRPLNLFTGEETTLGMDDIVSTLPYALLVSGIADPGPLLSYLGDYDFDISHLRYPDHHDYDSKDILRIKKKYTDLPYGKRCLFTTEKDAVRLREVCREDDFPDNNVFYLRINVSFLKEEDKFNKIILDYAGKNRRNDSLPQV